MAHFNNAEEPRIVAISDHAVGVRTIGGLLGQLEIVGLGREEATRILMSSGLPAVAYEDPSFPLSARQDFEILNEIRKHMWTDVSMEVGMFSLLRHMRVHMFGALGMAWQCAPTLQDAVKVSVSYPQLSWGRTQIVVSTSESGDYIQHQLEKMPAPLSNPEDAEGTYRYALLLDVVANAAIILDVVSDRSLLKKIELPLQRPQDWSLIEKHLKFPVEFNRPKASLILAPGFLQHVPRKAHPLSFKLAMQLVEKESAVLSEDGTFRDRVTRWLWAYTPPLSKAEIAKLLGLSERSLTRKLAGEGTSYNALFAEVQSERARNLLSNQKLTISQVAYRMGYADPAAFTRAFTARHGMTPSDWRSQALMA